MYYAPRSCETLADAPIDAPIIASALRNRQNTLPQ
jgi:hypothetical protein